MAASPATPATSSAPILLTKVFVGNLSFKTKEDELAAEFSAAGKVKSANIITRGPRSLGYGFVEMDTEEDAKKAVELMNKKSIDGREINVEIAKPRDESAVGTGAAPRAAPLARRGRGLGRGRGGPGRGRGSGAPNGASSPVPAGDNGGVEGEPRRRRFRSFRPRGTRGGLSAPGSDSPQSSRQPAPQRTPSQTSLFVANLPFSVDDGKLSEIFKGLKIKSAHVVRKKNGRSKGFGFVEFESETEQQSGLKSVDKLLVEGRELSVKVALTETKGEGSDSKSDVAAPATKSDDTPAQDNKQ